MQNKGILYLIPTPIGNLKEVSPRILSFVKIQEILKNYSIY